MTRKRIVWWAAAGVLVTILVALLAYLVWASTSVDRNTWAKADLIGLQTQLDVYKERNGSYPTTEQGLRALVVRPTSSPVPPDWIQHFRELPLDPWQHPYVYRYPSAKDPDTFDLLSFGPDGVQSNDDIWLPR